MASTPVPVTAKTAPPAPAQEPWPAWRDEMNRMFDRFSSGFGLPAFHRFFDTQPTRLAATIAAPAVDVTENDKAYKITAELAGMTEKDIDVALSGNRLTISGEKQRDEEHKDGNYHISERHYGSFHRSFAIPDGVDRDNVTAAFAKGVLTVTLPKTSKAKGAERKVDVKPA